MRGEQILILKKIIEHEGNPIPTNIKGVDKEKIVTTILNEYHNTFKRKLTFTDSNCIIMRNLGSFYTNLSRLKGYIWQCIKRIRKLRERVRMLSENPGFVKEQSMTWLIERDLTRKLGFAWKQLDQRRELMIMSYLRYNSRLKKKGEEHKIKYNYEWYPFKFIDAYGYNDNVFLFDIKDK